MKKLKYLLLVLICVIFPLKAKAGTLAIVLDCPATASVSETITCKIKGTVSGTVSSITMTYNLASGLELSTCTLSDQAYANTSTLNNQLGFSEPKSVGSSIELATLKIKIPSGANSNEQYTVKLQNITYDSETLETVSSSIRVKSSINSLSTLTVGSLSLVPTFDPNKNAYTAVTTESSVNIKALATDDNASISGDLGDKTLAIGENVFNINVVSESGSTRTYVIKVTRNDNRSANADLASLSLSTGTITPVFAANTLSYAATLDKNIVGINVKATLADASATFIEGYGPRSLTLVEGENIVEIKVLAQNGTEKVYTINVTRGNAQDSNAYLKSLTLSVSNILFTKDNYNYSVNTDYATETITIDAVPENSTSTVTLDGNTNLSVGENNFNIIVTAKNGDTKTYTVRVVRAAENENLDAPRLKSLTIKDHYVNFNTETFTYDVTITNEKTLDITAYARNDSDIVNISGNKDLKDGSKVVLMVTNVYGDVQTYTLNITKKISASYTIGASIFCAIACIVFIISLIALIKKRKKK